MAFPIISELLTAGARAAFPMLTSLVEAGVGSNEILRQVASAGFTLRRQAGLDVIGALRNNVNAARQFRMIADTTIPNPARFGTAATNLPHNYSYKVKVNFGGGVEPDWITVSSNSVLNKDQIMGAADSYASNEEAPSGIWHETKYTLEVTDALKSPALAEGGFETRGEY